MKLKIIINKYIQILSVEETYFTCSFKSVLPYPICIPSLRFKCNLVRTEHRIKKHLSLHFLKQFKIF